MVSDYCDAMLCLPTAIYQSSVVSAAQSRFLFVCAFKAEQVPASGSIRVRSLLHITNSYVFLLTTSY